MTFRFFSILIASLSVPAGTQTQLVDISGNARWQLAGSRGLSIKVTSPDVGADASVAVEYPKGDRFVSEFVNERLIGTMFERRDGDVRTILYDDDGDGLPEMRRIFKVFPTHDELVRAEQLEWTSKEKQ